VFIQILLPSRKNHYRLILLLPDNGRFHVDIIDSTIGTSSSQFNGTTLLFTFVGLGSVVWCRQRSTKYSQELCGAINLRFLIVYCEVMADR
jgi:hypothetical protein